jgi:hypothetical protein
VRQRVHLHGHGDLGQHRPDERRPLTDEQPTVRTDRERTSIDGVPLQQGADGPWARFGGRYLRELGIESIDLFAHVSKEGPSGTDPLYAEVWMAGRRLR